VSSHAYLLVEEEGGGGVVVVVGIAEREGEVVVGIMRRIGQ